MKRLIVTLLFVVPFLFVTSCSDNVTKDQNNKTNLSKVKADLSSIGKMHNDGLQHIYSDLKKHDKINSKKELNNTLEKSSRAFFKEEFQSEEMYEQASATISNQIEFANSTDKLQGNAKTSNERSFKSIINSSDKLNKKQKKLILKLSDTITGYASSINKKNSTQSTSSFKEKLEQINQQAADVLDSNKKLAPIVAGTIVAKSSMKYWQNNREKWNKMLNKKNNTIPSAFVSAKKNSDLKEIVKADAVGAVGGGMNAFLDGTAYLTSGGSVLAEAGAGALIGSGGWSAGELAGDAYDYVASFF